MAVLAASPFQKSKRITAMKRLGLLRSSPTSDQLPQSTRNLYMVTQDEIFWRFNRVLPDAIDRSC